MFRAQRQRHWGSANAHRPPPWGGDRDGHASNATSVLDKAGRTVVVHRQGRVIFAMHSCLTAVLVLTRWQLLRNFCLKALDEKMRGAAHLLQAIIPLHALCRSSLHSTMRGPKPGHIFSCVIRRVVLEAATEPWRGADGDHRQLPSKCQIGQSLTACAPYTGARERCPRRLHRTSRVSLNGSGVAGSSESLLLRICSGLPRVHHDSSGWPGLS